MPVSRAKAEAALRAYRKRYPQRRKEFSGMFDINRFLKMLTECEDVVGNRFNNWEREFIANMSEQFNAREDQADLGLTMWQPTRNQYNTLHDIWSKL